MASRKDQKEAARQRRLAEERAAAHKASRARRLQMVGGAVAAAIVVVVVLVIVSSGGSPSAKAIDPTSHQATQTTATVNKLLSGIPQHGNTLGSPNARVTVTEYGDLACPVCQEFALTSENQLIANDVRAGRVKLVYRALETASSIANSSGFLPSQTAALAAGRQKLGWNYIETFYHEQQSEDTQYVTPSFLQGLAKQVPGLNFATWNSDRASSALTSQVKQDGQQAQAQGFSSTPTILIQGPVAHAQPIVGAPQSYGQLEQAIKSVA